MNRIENPIRQAESDIKWSQGLNVVGKFVYLRERDGKKKGKIDRILVLAVGNLERGEGWNAHVGRTHAGEIKFESHTAFHKTPEGTSVLEVLLFEYRSHAETVNENLERMARNKLEHIPR